MLSSYLYFTNGTDSIIHGDQGKYGRITCPNFITENTTGYTENLIVQDCGHVAYNKKPMKIINTIDNL